MFGIWSDNIFERPNFPEAWPILLRSKIPTRRESQSPGKPGANITKITKVTNISNISNIINEIFLADSFLCKQISLHLKMVSVWDFDYLIQEHLEFVQKLVIKSSNVITGSYMMWKHYWNLCSIQMRLLCLCIWGHK